MLAQRIVPGLLPILYSSGAVSSPLKVHGEFCGNLVCPCTVEPLFTISHPPMQPQPPHRRYPFIEDRLIQCMQKLVTAANRPVWQHMRFLGMQELAAFH